MTTKITLYTAHHCPWAHRCQIALRELNLEFETVLVDILVPRTSEYLAINPNGMVPALKYENQILTESNFIAQFLVDSHPSHLLKSSAEIGGPKQRYEIGLFVSTFFSAVQSIFDRAVFSLAGQVKTGLVDDFINAVVEKIEPHLADTAAPYYGGSRHLTFAEVCFEFDVKKHMIFLTVIFVIGFDRAVSSTHFQFAQIRRHITQVASSVPRGKGTQVLEMGSCGNSREICQFYLGRGQGSQTHYCEDYKDASSSNDKWK